MDSLQDFMEPVQRPQVEPDGNNSETQSQTTYGYGRVVELKSGDVKDLMQIFGSITLPSSPEPDALGSEDLSIKRQELNKLLVDAEKVFEEARAQAKGNAGSQQEALERFGDFFTLYNELKEPLDELRLYAKELGPFPRHHTQMLGFAQDLSLSTLQAIDGLDDEHQKMLFRCDEARMFLIQSNIEYSVTPFEFDLFNFSTNTSLERLCKTLKYMCGRLELETLSHRAACIRARQVDFFRVVVKFYKDRQGPAIEVERSVRTIFMSLEDQKEIKKYEMLRDQFAQLEKKFEDRVERRSEIVCKKIPNTMAAIQGKLGQMSDEEREALTTLDALMKLVPPDLDS